jgi:endoglucanase Acf2
MLIFFSSTVRLDWDPTTFSYVAADVATGSFSGTVRTAFVDAIAAAGNDNFARDNATTVSFPEREQLLALHANTFPVAAEVLLQKDNAADDKAFVKYRWSTQAMNAAGNNELLMLALEKTQLPALVGSQPRPVLAHPSAFGQLQAVVGSLWTQQLALPAIMRGGPAADPNTIWFGKGRIRPEDKAAIRKVLTEDLATGQEFLPNCAYDSYVCGGFLFRFARMALIADELGEADLREQALEFTKHILQPWFDSQEGKQRGDGIDPNALTFDYFLYDTTNGGTVTNRGLKNVGEDYFNASYIDHMFHYGYYIYAAAVIARYDHDGSWTARYSEKVNTLVRDIANASLKDKHYPVMRMYDWYLMRNAADSGPDTNGPNTESSSEAINADYAITLWGVVTRNSALQAVGAIMAAGEIRSAQAWYQITESNSVFPGVALTVNDVLNPDGTTSSKTLAPTREMAMGILRTNKPEINTFFSALEHKVVGIQILPVSPISDAVLSRDWARAQNDRILKMIGTMTDQLGNIAGDGPNAGELKHQPGNPFALCATDINLDKNRDTSKDVGAAKCAGRARMLYNWRGIIITAYGLNNPADAYQRYLAYRNKVAEQTASFQARTVGAFNGNFVNGAPQTYVDGIANLDLLKSDTVPGSDVNVLWWLSSNKF